MDNQPALVIGRPQLIPDSVIALIKAVSIVGSMSLLIWFVLLDRPSFLGPKTSLVNDSLVPVATIPYTLTYFPDLGNDYTPLVTLPVEVNNHAVDITFLIDTGAIISTIPIAYAERLGVDVSTQKRILLQTLTNQAVYGYMVDAKVTLHETQLTLPLTLANIQSPVIGRYGFLDRYSLVFNHQEQAVTIAIEP